MQDIPAFYIIKRKWGVDMKKILLIATAVVTFLTAGLNVSAAGLKDVFQAKFYADKYADLYDAFAYDEEKLYEHFQIFGLNEKRIMNPVLDVVAYRETYPDLDAAFGDNWDAYVEHLYTFGLQGIFIFGRGSNCCSRTFSGTCNEK